MEQGKGGKDHSVMLSPPLLDRLRAWWKGRAREILAVPAALVMEGVMPASLKVLVGADVTFKINGAKLFTAAARVSSLVNRARPCELLCGRPLGVETN